MGMREEVEVISAVCENKDIHVLFENNVDYMMQSCGDVWDFVKEYYNETRQVPPTDLLQTRFRDFDTIENPSPTIYAVNRLKETFLDESLRTTVRKAAQFLQDNQSGKALNTMSSDISSLARITARVRDLDVTDVEDALQYFEKTRQSAMNGDIGIRSGIAAFDLCLPMGIAKGQLGVLLAYPAIGKSWMALFLAVKAWQNGRVPMILSLEMTEQEVRNRIFTIIGNGKWSHRAISSGRVNNDEFKEWAEGNLVDKPPFKIVSNDGGSEVTPNVVRAKIDQYKPDIVFIDYLQLMQDNAGTSSNETVKIKNLSRELKLLAISEQVPIIAIASATPDDASDLESVPQLGQVAWSRQIAYDADWVLAFGRKQNTGVLEVAFRKNRHGFLGDFYIDADFDSGKFEEMIDPADLL
jgi:replicative DNA helicase